MESDNGVGGREVISPESLVRSRESTLCFLFSFNNFPIAKDVKIQIEFNPAKGQSYRLVGYENRMLAAEDFNDDTKDAGEIGSGHTVTALYEIIPIGVTDSFAKSVDLLKYQANEKKIINNGTNEIMTIKLRYKQPDGDISKLIQQSVVDSHIDLASTSDNFCFSAAVAEFGLLLRNSEYKQQGTYQQVISLAKTAKGKDDNGYRSEFIGLAESTVSFAKN